MTSKLLRTTSVIALTAFSVTALCAAASSVRAEPGDTMRIAQKVDGGDDKQPDADNNDADGKKRGEGRRRDGNRQERGEGGNNRGRDGGGRDARDGNAPAKTFNRPDIAKPNAPKIINNPNAIERRDQRPATNPVVNPDVSPEPRPARQPTLRRQQIETTAPPIKRPIMPGMVAPPRIAEPPIKKFTPQDRRPQQAAQPALVRPQLRNLNDAKLGRVERREDGGNRLVIVEKDKRQIVRQGNRIVIQKDESAQLRRMSPDAVVTRDKRGRDRTVVQRRDNSQVVTETDRNGQLLRRFRRDRDGRETVIIDNRHRGKDKFGRNLAIGVGVGAGIIAGAAILNSVVDVPPPRVRVPRDKYIVDYERASEDDVYEALNAPPVDDIDRSYTLDQVRATSHLRERMRRVDLDDITFETGSWDIDPGQYRKLERIARAMRRVINRNPNEVFLIEGYTDAVGSDVDNLTLSDRRAEAVSVVLSEEFDVPFENLTTQGYGEEYLKIPTDGPERANRRVAARRITPLLNRDNISAAPPPPDQRDYDDRGDPDDEPQHDRRWRRYN